MITDINYGELNIDNDEYIYNEIKSMFYLKSKELNPKFYIHIPIFSFYSSFSFLPINFPYSNNILLCSLLDIGKFDI